MESLVKFLEDKITDKMSVEEIVDVFEQMCSTPLEEDMVLFETGTFTEFSKEPFFQISLVRQFSNSDEEFYQIHVVILYKPTVPFPVSWTVKMKKKQKETQDILSYHSQAAGCSDKARAKASGGRQPIEECGRTGL